MVIRGGQVVTPQGVGLWDVAIQQEKIVALAAPGTLTADVARTVSVPGKIVLPGGIDPHVHCTWPVGLQGLSASPSDVSRAALFGGTTTIVDFAVWQPGTTLQQTIESREKDYGHQCYCDYSYHVMLEGRVPPDVLDQIPDVIAAGFPSIKVFTTDVRPGGRRRLAYGDIWEVLVRTARHGGVVAVHAEDDDLVMHMYEKFSREGRTHYSYMPEVHSSLSEDLAFRRIIRLAEQVPGAALYLLHVSAAAGVHAIAEARSKGLPIHGETLHQYALFDADYYQRPDGQIYHTFPALRTETDQRTLWEGMASGVISTVATDEICTTRAVKVKGSRIDDVTGGSAGIEVRMGVMYTEAVARRGFPLERFADLTATNAAKILGLYPRKGVIAVGSDADICVIDPTIQRRLHCDDLHETDYSPWEGWEVTGWPVLTILRGKVAVESGQLKARLTDGRIVERKTSSTVLSELLSRQGVL